MIPTEKPGTPEELAHFGVKGMKWGVRRSQSTHEFKKSFPTSRERTAEIRRARLGEKTTRQAYKAAQNPENRRALKDIHLQNPDRATAYRLTRGEKVAFALLAGALSPATAAGIGIGTGIRVGRRRSIEAQQGR